MSPSQLPFAPPACSISKDIDDKNDKQPAPILAMTTLAEEQLASEPTNNAMRLRGGCCPCSVCYSCGVPNPTTYAYSRE